MKRLLLIWEKVAARIALEEFWIHHRLKSLKSISNFLLTKSFDTVVENLQGLSYYFSSTLFELCCRCSELVGTVAPEFPKPEVRFTIVSFLIQVKIQGLRCPYENSFMWHYTRCLGALVFVHLRILSFRFRWVVFRNYWRSLASVDHRCWWVQSHQKLLTFDFHFYVLRSTTRARNQAQPKIRILVQILFRILKFWRWSLLRNPRGSSYSSLKRLPAKFCNSCLPYAFSRTTVSHPFLQFVKS